jgi:hypothetical protein
VGAKAKTTTARPDDAGAATGKKALLILDVVVKRHYQ